MVGADLDAPRSQTVPWTSLKPTRTWLSGASAQASDAAVKTRMPAR